MSRTAPGIIKWAYLRASLAVIIPVTLMVNLADILRCEALDAMIAKAGGPLPMLACAVALVAGEAYCLAALRGVIRFRGSAADWLQWRAGPVAAAARHRWRFRALTAGLGSLAGLVLAEIVVRGFHLHDPAFVPQLVDYTDFLEEPRNRLNIREEWDLLDPADGRFRLAVLGDSIVYGLGVPCERTFTRLLQEELRTDLPQGLLTINLGGPGTAPREQLVTFRSLQQELRPDLVLQVIYPNDLGIELRPLAHRLRNLRTEPFWTGRFSCVLHLIELRIREFILWRGALAYYRGGATTPERERAWQKLEADVTATCDAVLASGSEYGLIMFPWLIEFGDYPLNDVHDRARSLARRLGVPYLDLLEAFEGRAAAEYRIDPTDEHPNEAGHRLAAEHIAEFVRQEFLANRGALLGRP